MYVRLLRDCEGPGGKMPKGHVFNHPDGFKLVQLGMAEACDDEARVAAGVMAPPADGSKPKDLMEEMAELKARLAAIEAQKPAAPAPVQSDHDFNQ